MRYFFDLNAKSFERFSAGLISKDDYDYRIILPALDSGKVAKSQVIERSKAQIYTDSDGSDKSLKKSLGDLRLSNSKIGVEDTFPLKMMQTFQKVSRSIEFVDVTKMISGMRIIKDPSELAAIRKSSEILTKAIQAGVDLVRPRLSENEVGLEIKKSAVKQGAEAMDFCAVQSGANSAVPHHETSRRNLQRGDVVVIDASCTYDGYFADITRSFIVGKEPGRKLEKIYQAVLGAQMSGLQSIAPNTSCESVDVKTRLVLEKSGYGDYFVHRTGHGLGIEVHEPPFIRAGNRERIRPDMVFTVEPGVYLPGKFGIRIEDDVAVTENGYENFTKMPKDELIVLR